MPTNYPGSADAFPLRLNGQAIDASHIDGLQDAVTAIETELGGNPSGPSSTVASRLSALDTYRVAAPTGVAATDTAAIQAQIDAAGSAGGALVQLLPGTYNLNATITLRSNVVLQGAGELGTYVVQTAAGIDAFAGVDLSHVGFRDLHITGPGSGGRADPAATTGTGIKMTLSGTLGNATFYPFLDNVYVEKFGLDGIYIQTPIVCRVSRVVAFSNNRHGINITSSGDADGTSTHLQACFAAGNFGAGYHITQMAYTALDACAADANGVGYEFSTCIAVVEVGCGSEEPYDFSAHQPGYVGYSRWVKNTRSYTAISPYAVGNIGTAYYLTAGTTGAMISPYEGSPGNTDSPTNNPTYSIQVDADCSVTITNPRVLTPTSYATGTTLLLASDVTGASNIQVGTTSAGLGGGSGVISVKNAATLPTSNPTAGGILYVDSGALKYRGSSGTITTIAPA